MLRDLLSSIKCLLWALVIDPLLRSGLFADVYYIVEFDIEGQGPFPAYHRVEFFGGCPDTGIFTSYADALRYWEYREQDCTDPGFRYTITRLPKSDELVQDFIASQQGEYCGNP